MNVQVVQVEDLNILIDNLDNIIQSLNYLSAWFGVIIGLLLVLLFAIAWGDNT